MGVDWDAMYEEYRYRGPAERKLLLLRKNQEPGPEPDAGCACGGMYSGRCGVISERSEWKRKWGWQCGWCEAARWQEQYDMHWAKWAPEPLSVMEAEVREAQMEMYQI